jgi:hypothetical protein
MLSDAMPDRIVSLIGFKTWAARITRRLEGWSRVIATRLRRLGRPGELVWLLIGLLALVAWLWILWRGSIHHR